MMKRITLLIAVSLIIISMSSELYSQSLDQICFESGLLEPVLASPGDGSTDVSVTPILEIMTFGSPDPSCIWDQTEWYILPNGGGQPLISPIVFNPPLDSYSVPAGNLQHNTDYCWYATIVSSSGGPGGSRVARMAPVMNCFTTRSSNQNQPPPQGQNCLAMPEPVLIKPFDNAIDVPLEETFEFNPNANVLDPNCTFSESEIFITTNANPANIVYSQTLNAGSTSFKIGPNALQADASYCWYVVNYSLGTGPGGTDVTSNVTAENCFQTEKAATQPSPGGPPGGGPPSGLSSYDMDRDCKLSDAEFFKMVDDWVLVIISDPMFFQGVDAWINDWDLCIASSAVEPIVLDLEQRGSLIALSLKGEEISQVTATIFDLNGHLVYFEEAVGARLSLDLGHQNLANGVWLYSVHSFDQNGRLIGAHIGKLVLIR